jgi:hypothetical protein
MDIYEYLKNNLPGIHNPILNEFQDNMRRYLKELISIRIDYMDKNGKRK